MFNTSYELHILVGGRWVLEATDRQLRRISTIKGRKLTSPVVEGVRVVKVTSALVGAPSRRVVEERLKRQRHATSSSLTTGSPGHPPLCAEPRDLLRYDARYAIGRILIHFFMAKQATPAELLFDPEMQRNLLEQGDLLERAIGVAARAQDGEGNSPAMARASTLDGLIKRRITACEAISAGSGLPVLDSRKVDAFCEILEAETAGEMSAFADAAGLRIAQAMIYDDSFTAKLRAMLTLIEGVRSRPFLAVADKFIADLFAIDAVVAAVVGTRERPIEQLEAIAQLAHGQPVETTVLDTSLGDALAIRIAGHHLPQTRLGLMDAVSRQLASRDRLVLGTLRAEELAVMDFVKEIEDLLVVAAAPRLIDPIINRLLHARNVGGAENTRRCVTDLIDSLGNGIAKLCVLDALISGQHREAVAPIFASEAERALVAEEDVQGDMRCFGKLEEGRALLLRLGERMARRAETQEQRRKFKWRSEIILARYELGRR